MAHHSNYWSCSKLADWIRGNDKLPSGSGKEWEDWHNESESKHPWRFWIAEELLDNIQDFITWPVRKLYNIKYYINNRWIARSHALTSSAKDVKRGQWCDLTERILYCLFNELVDFVEIESAGHWVAWNPEERTKFKAPFWSCGWFKLKVWRSVEAGRASLEWQANLTEPVHQAEGAKEILELYTWWTFTRPERPDPFEASGWTALCDRKRDAKQSKRFAWGFYDDEDDAAKQLTRDTLDKLHEIEKQYHNEDEEMMIRFIKVKDSLWT